MQILPKLSGFTLVELVVVLGLIGVFTIIGTTFLFGYLEKQQLLAEQERVAATLQRSRDRSVTAEKGRQYGIRFETAQFIELPDDQISKFRYGVQVSSVTIPELFFEKISGQRIPQIRESEQIVLVSRQFQVLIHINRQGIVSLGKIEKR